MDEQIKVAIRKAGGIVHADGNIFFTNAEQFTKAAAALSQPAAADGGWISTAEFLPECDNTPSSFGVSVLVHPPFDDGCGRKYQEAFYGCRHTDAPNFYLFGRVFVPDFWQYPISAPKAPKATP